MRRYRFEVRQDQNIALFDILYGDMQVVLRSVDGD
jgi:hypothetical protein